MLEHYFKVYLDMKIEEVDKKACKHYCILMFYVAY